MQPSTDPEIISPSDFYSRTSCEVQLFFFFFPLIIKIISIHAPLARCNKRNTFLFSYFRNFYSRTSCEVQPKFIHFFFCLKNFYSRTSCEVQHRKRIYTQNNKKFLLTHLLRGATLNINRLAEKIRFLLTHLLRGATFYKNYQFLLIIISTHAPLARCN